MITVSIPSHPGLYSGFNVISLHNAPELKSLSCSLMLPDGQLLTSKPVQATVSALDQYGHVLASFNGPVSLTPDKGFSINPGTVTLENGTWIGPITITYQ